MGLRINHRTTVEGDFILRELKLKELSKNEK